MGRRRQGMGLLVIFSIRVMVDRLQMYLLPSSFGNQMARFSRWGIVRRIKTAELPRGHGLRMRQSHSLIPSPKAAFTKSSSQHKHTTKP
jgi:hypothetical protein